MNKIIDYGILLMRLSLTLIAQCATIFYSSAQSNNNDFFNENSLQSDMPMFETYSENLSSKICNQLLEDSDGFIWVASRNGVMRFDGITFASFLNTEVSSNVFENDICSITEDTINNCIWNAYQTKDILVRINKEDYSSDTLFLQLHYKSNLAIRALHSYNDSTLIGVSTYGIFLINIKNGEMQGPIQLDKSVGINYAYFSKHPRSGNTYLITCNNVYQIINNGSVPTFKHINILPNKKIRHMSWCNDTTCILQTYENSTNTSYIYKITNLNYDNSKPIFSTQRNIKDVTSMDDGIWLSTNRGLIFYSFRNGDAKEFNLRNSTLKTNQLTQMLRSRNQPILWICSDNGLIKNDYFSSKFYKTDLNRFSESETCSVLSLFKDFENDYWFWMIDGLFRKEHNSEFFKKEYLNGYLDNNAKRFGMIRNMFENAEEHKIYFAFTQCIIEYNKVTKKCTTIASSIKKKMGIKASFKIDNNNILYIDDETINITKLKNKKTTSIPLPDSTTISPHKAYLESDSLLWYSSHNNIYSFNLKNQRFTLHKTLHSTTKLSISRIRTVRRNDIHEVWIGTNKGLFYYYPDKDTIVDVTYSSILTFPIKTIEVDNNKNIWVISEKGIVCIDNIHGQYHTYKEENFSLFKDFYLGASYTNGKGEIIVGGNNYFIEFDSNNFAQNQYFPTPIISSYKLLNSVSFANDVLTTNEYYTSSDTIVVPPGIRSLLLNARVLNYSKSEVNRYEWKTESDTVWHQANTSEPIYIASLNQGISTIELRANSPYANKSSKTYYILKEVYFYQDHRFIFIAIAVTSIIIAIFIILRIQSAKRHREELEREVKRQAGEILKANIILNDNQQLIEEQNKKLTQSHENLEKQVAQRTADLEVAKQKAEENSKLKSAFLANLSHEVRTPMNCIVGFAKLLSDPTCTQPEQEEFIHLIQESAGSLLTLLGDLLDVSRIESGQMRVNIKPFNILNEINDVFKILNIEHKKVDVDFTLNASASLNNRIINSDKDRFRQIIINITYNAFKFTENGHVAINAEITNSKNLKSYKNMPESFTLPSTDEVLVISIEDTGIGIPHDKMDIIFEPFRKLNNNKTLYPGLGLGLNISQNLVHLLGGQIWLTSQEMVGTTFYFYLPI
ncbi:MAG: hypothetical protein HUJ96_02420 [Marinilabiliaceae bacterium]|nr:hypothetical protein [Marinilabiliaceae bacterium]